MDTGLGNWELAVLAEWLADLDVLDGGGFNDNYLLGLTDVD